MERTFELKTDADDRRRERQRRPTVCCAPDMCPTCWDWGGHGSFAEWLTRHGG